jgi:hypothetical protein
MFKTVLFACTALTLAGAPPAQAQVQGQAPAAPAEAARPVEVPPITFSDRTLPNGMRVLAMVDRSTPNVGLQLFYHVGAKDDPPRRSGFAHLFEHLMFKRTRNMPDEMFDRLTEDVGGVNNAGTWDDFTNYMAVVPANHLERILWAEADRMSGLIVDQASFASERDVVKEELRQRVLSDPYGRFWRYVIPEASYTVHPYRRPGIGSIEDLTRRTSTTCAASMRPTTGPDNADPGGGGQLRSRSAGRLGRPLLRPRRPARRGDPRGDRCASRRGRRPSGDRLRAERAAAGHRHQLADPGGAPSGYRAADGAGRDPVHRTLLASVREPDLRGRRLAQSASSQIDSNEHPAVHGLRRSWPGALGRAGRDGPAARGRSGCAHSR